MMRRYLLPALAVVGVAIAVVAVVLDNRPAPVPRAQVLPPKPPFASYLYGSGIVEASSGNIAVGTPVPGIVTAIYVKWGDRVKPGDPLFKVDDRDLQARLAPALARVGEAEARLASAREQLGLADSVPDKRAVSLEEIDSRRSAVAIGEAELATAKAEAKRIRVEIERHTVRALVAGQILQLRIRPGEFAQGGAPATPLMLLGSDTRLYLRVDIDEYDAWRFRPGTAAMAFVRSNPGLRTPLRFERVDPYVVPKTSLTGDSTERADTRVLQVLYSFDPASLPVYVGQQMDAFIEAPPAGRTAHQGAP